MGNDSKNITLGKPNPKGALYVAPVGTALPTDAITPLTSAFVNLGFLSDDGLTETTAEDGDDIKAWGGTNVMRTQSGFGVSFTGNLIETKRESVLAFIYGAENVVVGADGKITYKVKKDQLKRFVFVAETIQNNGGTPALKRQIVAEAQLTDRSGDHTYNDSDPLSFPFNITAYEHTDSASGWENNFIITHIEDIE